MLAPPVLRRALSPLLWVALLALAPAVWLLSDHPDDPVLTTAGPRPRGLVHLVGEGEALREIDGIVRRVDLATGETVDSAPPASLLSTEAADLEAGWITFAGWKNRSGPPLTSFASTWTVPPAPATRSRQTIFLFNGIQNSGANYGILQPVLQWGRSHAGGGNYWSVASWYVTSRGQAFHTPLQRVAPGDVLVGEMALVAQARDRFDYSCEFRGMAKTRLLLQNVAELTWSTESLEAYGVRRCSDYPATRGVPFTAIALRRSNGPPAMDWTPFDRVTDCDQHTEVVSSSPVDGRVDLQMRR